MHRQQAAREEQAEAEVGVRWNPAPGKPQEFNTGLIKGSILFSTDNKHQHYWSRHQLKDLYIQKMWKLNMLFTFCAGGFSTIFLKDKGGPSNILLPIKKKKNQKHLAPAFFMLHTYKHSRADRGICW